MQCGLSSHNCDTTPVGVEDFGSFFWKQFLAMCPTFLQMLHFPLNFIIPDLASRSLLLSAFLSAPQTSKFFTMSKDIFSSPITTNETINDWKSKSSCDKLHINILARCLSEISSPICRNSSCKFFKSLTCCKTSPPLSKLSE